MPKSKNVLMISPLYFGYENKIYAELESRGYVVKLLYENMQEISFVYRFLHSRFRTLFMKKMNQYIITHLEKEVNYDYIFVIRGSSVSPELMQELKRRYTNAKTIMYQWDSVNNNPNAVGISKYFDKIFSFDFKDATDEGWIYRPLFYANKYENEEKEIDICYICSLHSNRARILDKIKEIARDKNIVLFHHLYSKRIIYVFNKYFRSNAEFINAVDHDIKFNSLTIDQSFDYYCKSKCIVDYSHPRQSGLTIRSIEAIGAKCKIITNNRNVVNESIYKYGNVYIYDENDLDIPVSFITSDYKEIPQEVSEYYSLKHWVDDIFCKE